ncbi:oxygen-insensitive NAD(P)H nitroreductase [Geminocystis sp. NIES-3708]|nr:oxygen-insensitive NAD(P)H nitroreductase [Geminocystis sp. NIES-3708]
MNTLEAIKKRRSVKHFDANHEMTATEINILMEHALLSPTSFNLQNWRFVVVKDKVIKQQLKAASFNQAQVSDASIVIVICGDLKAWAKNPQRYWKNATEDVQAQIVPMIGGFYENNPELQRDEAMRSAGIAGQTIMLAAKAMGYDSCPMIGFNSNKVAEIINLPDDNIIGLMIVVGKATQSPKNRAGQLDMSEVVFLDHF